MLTGGGGGGGGDCPSCSSECYFGVDGGSVQEPGNGSMHPFLAASG